MIDDNVLTLRMYLNSVPKESRDEDYISFLKAQYCANKIEKDIATLKYLGRQYQNPITHLFSNECLAGMKPSRQDNAKNAMDIKLKNLLRFNRYLTNYFLKLQEKLENFE